MKNVLTTLFLLSGLGMTTLVAQTCAPCPPCPPGCSIQICKDNKTCEGKSVATCTPAEVAACKAAMVTCATTQSGVTTKMAALRASSVQTPSCASGATVETAKCVGHVEAAKCNNHTAPTSTPAPNERPVKLAAIKG